MINDIENGKFEKDWSNEKDSNNKYLNLKRKETIDSNIEKLNRKLLAIINSNNQK